MLALEGDPASITSQVNLFGGELGNYEGNLGTSDGGCVDNPFRWCDNLSNNDPNVLTFMSKAFANTVVRMAFDRSGAGASAARVKPSRAKLEPAAATDGGRLASR